MCRRGFNDGTHNEEEAASYSGGFFDDPQNVVRQRCSEFSSWLCPSFIASIVAACNTQTCNQQLGSLILKRVYRRHPQRERRPRVLSIWFSDDTHDAVRIHNCLRHEQLSQNCVAEGLTTAPTTKGGCKLLWRVSRRHPKRCPPKMIGIQQPTVSVGHHLYSRCMQYSTCNQHHVRRGFFDGTHNVRGGLQFTPEGSPTTPTTLSTKWVALQLTTSCVN